MRKTEAHILIMDDNTEILIAAKMLLKRHFYLQFLPAIFIPAFFMVSNLPSALPSNFWSSHALHISITSSFSSIGIWIPVKILFLFLT